MVHHRDVLRFIRGSDRRAINYARTYGNVFELSVDDKKAAYKRFPTYEAGIGAFHAAVAAAYADGFALEHEGHPIEAPPPGDPFVPLPELEAAAEASNDLDTWLVLADAWTERGDPRGPCIHLSRAFTNVTDPAVFAANKKAAAAAHRARASYLLGPLGRDAYRVEVAYAHGLPSSATLLDKLEAPGRSNDELAALLRANPFCRFADVS